MSLEPIHRARRFMRSIVARPPTRSEVEWAHSWLSAPERALFDSMSAADRCHSIAVAHSVVAGLERPGQPRSDGDTRWMVAAALLHDVGKTVAALGTSGRVVATLSEAVGGASMAEAWEGRRGVTRKVGLYLRYPEHGAALLTAAGSDERVVAWAAQHHRPESDWTVPLDAGRLLAGADDEAC